MDLTLLLSLSVKVLSLSLSSLCSVSISLRLSLISVSLCLPLSVCLSVSLSLSLSFSVCLALCVGMFSFVVYVTSTHFPCGTFSLRVSRANQAAVEQRHPVLTGSVCVSACLVTLIKTVMGIF